ncbi:restriction endonuclease subunit S [Bacillus spizizenii]|uniref:restriction endonuclease subunit S n=1 Tax=Bacillus subtilis group TaxID=653685 RepID=UPI002DBFD15D|nr:restriction endonuclease subunit S [Bacillus spizizenii]MEC2184937.1 restriction endonuclease subunit S [Bacillus spizizenii]
MGNRNIPEVRFSGFAGEWEQCTLHSMVDRVKSYSLSRDVETSEYTGYKYIHYGDIHTKVADIIDEFSDLPNIKAGTYELLEKGDLVLADASEDYQGIAAPAVVTIDVPYKLVSGLHTIALRPKQVDSLFLYYLINSPIFRKYGYKTGTGMKVFGISATNLLKFESLFPVLEEQTKIGNFFKQLDDTIALHQQELTTLKQTKQGFLQKMFPKEGKSVPEVRFSGFTGDWEQRKLREMLAEPVTDGPHETPKLEESGIPFISVDAIVDNQIDFDRKRGYISEETDELYSKKYRPQYHDVFLVKSGSTVGKTAIVETKERFNIWSPLAAMRVGEVSDPYFLYFLLQTRKMQNQVKDKASSGTQPNLGMRELEKFHTQITPNLEEQKKIGAFFQQLDNLITLHQRELEALKKTKKAFLQKMFV